MNPPTATPRTDAALYPMNGVEIVWPYFARQLETELAAAKGECERLKFATEGHLLKTIQQQAELAAAKAECERLMNQRDNLLKPLRARAEDRADAADEKVERLTSENEKLTIERDALANGSAIEIARLRADLERFTGHGLLDCHAICDQRDAAIAERDRLRAEIACRQEIVRANKKLDLKIRDSLRAENIVAHQMACAAGWERDQLRAELKELSQAYELNRVSIDELDADRARAEKAEAALAEWSVLNLWGGTPEIIHEFIKGQQNRIHHCQDLEAELAEAVDGEINGGSIPDTLLVIHVPRSPVGYRVGQPVKVILPAIDAAMKGTT